MSVKFVRGCDCDGYRLPDFRDLHTNKWQVMESSHQGDPNAGIMSVCTHKRILAKDISYAQAMTLAHTYVIAQPGEVNIGSIPTLFINDVSYSNHVCNDLYDFLELPEGKYLDEIIEGDDW